jgi:hypothetical protein
MSTLYIILTIWAFIGFVSALIIMIKCNMRVSNTTSTLRDLFYAITWLLLGIVTGPLMFIFLCTGEWK